MTPTLWFIAGTSLALAGLALAAWSLLIAGRARGRVRCPGKGWGPLRRGCWYDLSGSPPDAEGITTCPECGRRIARRRDMLRTQRLWGTAAVGIASAALGVALWTMPLILAEDWRTAAPSALLVRIADATGAPAGDPAWEEILRRAKSGRLNERQRRLAAARLMNTVTDEQHRWIAAETLWMIALLRTDVPGLSELLVSRLSALDPDVIVRQRYKHENDDIASLGVSLIHAIIATGTSEAIPVLKQIDRRWGRDIALWAAAALLVLGDPDAMHFALESLESLRRPYSFFYGHPVYLCIALRAEEAENLVPLLTDRSRSGDSDALLADMALEAIRSLDLPIAVIVARRLHEANAYRCEDYMQWLVLMDAHAPAVPIVHELASEQDPQLRAAALHALIGLNAHDRNSIRVLRRLADDEHPYIRDTATRQLREIGR